MQKEEDKNGREVAEDQNRQNRSSDADQRPQLEFEAGNIHKERYRKFWREELNASSWVLKTLEEGYAIPFTEEPGAYEEPNNASAKENMKEVRALVAEMIANGVAKIVREKPLCVSPLGLVTRKVEGKVKNRLVFDASRWLNLKIEEQHVKLTHLEMALELTEDEDYQATFDLKSAFYHIKIRDDHHKYLGAQIENSDGSKLFFVYTHLPFGLKCAVHAITKMMKPVLAKLQLFGIRSTIYIDDGRILAKTREEAEEYLLKSYEVLEAAGWILERKKSDRREDVSTTKKYLGFIIDTIAMKVSATDDKIEKIESQIKFNLKREMVEVKEMAQIMGRIVSMKPSHGPLARICTRSGYLDIDDHVRVRSRGWKGKLQISAACRQELMFWMMNSKIRNGFPIMSTLKSVRVDSIFQNPILKTSSVRTFDTNHTHRTVSDSSDVKAAIIQLDEGVKTTLSFVFSEEERGFSSGHRELLAIKKSLAHWAANERIAMSKRKIYWATDSTNVVSFLEKGSSKRHVQSEVFEITNRLLELESDIIPVHLCREDIRIQEADELSKTKDSDDWSIDETSFQRIKERFRLTTDVFSNENNARLPIFFTELYSERSAGTNSFAQKWETGLWLCPPIKLLVQTAREIRRRKNCKGVLTVPDWPTSHFYGAFFRSNKEPREPFVIVDAISPYIYQNQGAKGALNGRVSFKMFILYFNHF
jgi:hypothetical protein